MGKQSKIFLSLFISKNKDNKYRLITPLRNELLFQPFREQWISSIMKIPHPWQWKQSKSCGTFWSYQLISNAILAHLVHFQWAGLAVLFIIPDFFFKFSKQT